MTTCNRLLALLLAGLLLAWTCGAARPSNLALPVAGGGSAPQQGGDAQQAVLADEPPQPGTPPSAGGTPPPPGDTPPPTGDTLKVSMDLSLLQQPQAPAQPTTTPAQTTTPSSGGGTGGGRQCVILPQTNADGEVLRTRSLQSIAECCAACKAQAGCSVFVYCERSGGW